MNDISLGYGVQLSIMSMLIVFVLLYIISLILQSFKVIFKEGKEEKKPDVIAKTQVKNEIKTETVIVSKKGITFEELEKDQDMLMAAMVASMEASGENKESNYKIVSIKQL